MRFKSWHLGVDVALFLASETLISGLPQLSGAQRDFDPMIAAKRYRKLFREEIDDPEILQNVASENRHHDSVLFISAAFCRRNNDILPIQ